MLEVRYVGLPPDRYGPLNIRRSRDFEVVGAGFFDASNECLSASEEVVSDASLTSLRHAFARFAKDIGSAPEAPVSMFVSPDPAQSFDEYYAVYDSVHLKVSAEEISLVASCTTAELVPSSEPVRRLLRPLMKRRGDGVTNVTRIDGLRGAELQVDVTLDTRGRTVEHALRLGRDVERLLSAAFSEGSSLTPATAANLLRTGHGSVLVGQPEAEWLEVKSRLYDFDDDHGKFFLARDVAAMANAGGGVLVVGFRRRGSPSGDLIGELRPVDVNAVSTSRHYAVLRDWLHPRLTGVRIDIVPADDAPGKGTLVIDVPPQTAATLPVIVRRAEFAGKLRAEHFTIPVRLGEDTAYWDLGEIHTLIVAGRAALGASRLTDG